MRMRFIIERPGRKFRTWLTEWRNNRLLRQSLVQIRHVPDPRASRIADAIEKTCKKNLTQDEKNHLSCIDALRTRCICMGEEIDYIDYGAGEPEAPRTQAEAREGIQRKVTLERLAIHTSKIPPWTDLIFNLVRALRPQRCLELGTCIGFSASYQCTALTLNEGGTLITLEGDESLASRAEDHLRSLDLSNYQIVVGRFEDTLRSVLEDNGPFDFMLNDGHHDGNAMLSYFGWSLPFLCDDAVLLFDDIDNYTSMRRAWRSLIDHKRVQLVVDFGPMGLVCLGDGTKGTAVFHCPL